MLRYSDQHQLLTNLAGQKDHLPTRLAASLRLRYLKRHTRPDTQLVTEGEKEEIRGWLLACLKSIPIHSHKRELNETKTKYYSQMLEAWN